MSQSQGSDTLPIHRLEEFVQRQTFALEKLERDGAYPCELRAAKRMLKSFEAKLETARRQNRGKRTALQPSRKARQSVSFDRRAA